MSRTQISSDCSWPFHARASSRGRPTAPYSLAPCLPRIRRCVTGCTAAAQHVDAFKNSIAYGTPSRHQDIFGAAHPKQTMWVEKVGGECGARLPGIAVLDRCRN